MNQDSYLARLLKYDSGLRPGGATSGPAVVASYWTAEGVRPFAFCRDGLLIDPDGAARFVAFKDIKDSGLHHEIPLRAAKEEAAAGKSLEEGLSLRLIGGEQIDLPLNSRIDGMSERLTIAGLIDRYARIHRAKS